MKTTIHLVTLLLFFILAGCTPEAEPIAYGSDNCQHCKMTITDSRYGSEMVTAKGKIFKFDSIECLAQYINESENPSEAKEMVLVTDFTNPNTLIDAKNAVYLQSENMPSPMGMFLTAFSDNNTANKILADKGGKILTWEETREVCKSHERN